MSRESFVRGAVSNPEQSTFYSDARVSSTMRAETTDLVTPDLIQGNSPKSACNAPPKKENYILESFYNFNKKFSFVSIINLLHRFYVFIFV